MTASYFVLSARNLVEYPSNAVAVELEDLILDVTDGLLLAPTSDARESDLPVLQENHLNESAKDKILIIVALWTDIVSHVNCIPGWRDKFRFVVAYVIDPWQTWDEWPVNVPRELDCFVVPDKRTAKYWHETHGVQTLAVPLGVDVLTYGCNRINRPLDVAAYGRQEKSLLTALKQTFNHPSSERFLYHTTAWRNIQWNDNRRLIWKILHKSKASLCFDIFEAPHENRTYHFPIIPARYYEAAAAGAAIVGRHADIAEMKRDFGWEDALIELPRDPYGAIDALEELFEDHERLSRIHQRNHAEAWHRHDWRYRLKMILEHLGIDMTPRLVDYLAILRAGSKE